MASVWGIDIGKAALKAVKLRKTKEGLEIQAIEYIPYPVEDDEDERQEHVNDAIRSFLTKHKLKSEKIVVGIPGLHAFSRFINLPPVEKSKVSMMVRMEAQQQIPFPISEVNWDYVQIDRDYEPGEELEFGIFATRSELIDGFLADLDEHKLAPDVVTIAPLAIYNFVRLNNEDQDGATVILDIGAEHTDLVIVDGERFWIRNLRIAGNDITKALAERFKIPFAEAEKLKKSSSKSAQARKIFGTMEPVLKDLVGEIHRSVGFFKSQAEDLKVRRMVLLGDGSRLKNLTKFLKEQLRYSVKRISKLQSDNFVIDDSVDLDLLSKHLMGFGVSLGLAMQGADAARCAINLAPQQLQILSTLKAKIPLAFAAVVLAWAALGVSYTYWSGARDEVAVTLKKIGKLKDYKRIQEEAEKLKDFSAPEKTAKELVSLGDGRLLLLQFLEKLRSELPTENHVLLDVSGGRQEKKLNEQIDDLLRLEEERKTNDERFWVLEMEAKPLQPEEGPDVGKKGYKILLRVARPWPRGAKDPGQMRDEIESGFVTTLKNRLVDEPFFVRSGGTYGDINVSTPTTLYGLDPSRIRDDGRNSYECIMVTLTFEIGISPPPPPKPAEGEGEDDLGDEEGPN